MANEIFRKGENWWKKKRTKKKLRENRFTHLPTKFSSTELFPALWPPTTAICGRSSCIATPSCVNASWSLLTIGINCSIPVFPAMFSPLSLDLDRRPEDKHAPAHPRTLQTRQRSLFLLAQAASLFFFFLIFHPRALHRTVYFHASACVASRGHHRTAITSCRNGRGSSKCAL